MFSCVVLKEHNVLFSFLSSFVLLTGIPCLPQLADQQFC